MKNFIDFEKLERLSEADKDVHLYKKIIKLQEECGEVAQEFLAYDDKQNGLKTNSSKSAEGTIEAVIEETCDTINVAIDILNFIEMKHPHLAEYIEKRFQEKLDKWESKIFGNKFLDEYNQATREVAQDAVFENMKTILKEETVTARSCADCKFLDTSTQLLSNPPRYKCDSKDSGISSVKCDGIHLYLCDFHEHKINKVINLLSFIGSCVEQNNE